MPEVDKKRLSEQDIRSKFITPALVGAGWDLQTWTDIGREKLVIFEALAEEVGRDYDAFDLICHVAFDQPPLTCRERAEQVRKRNYFTKYGDQVRLFGGKSGYDAANRELAMAIYA